MKYIIEKGDKFKCTKTFKMESGEKSYTRGEIYTSDNNDCITDNEPDIYHNMSGQKDFFEYFKPLMK